MGKGRVSGAPQYRLDKENHREKYSKKQSNSRKKQSCGSSNPANMDVFFEPFLLQFLLSKRYWGVPTFPLSSRRRREKELLLDLPILLLYNTPIEIHNRL